MVRFRGQSGGPRRSTLAFGFDLAEQAVLLGVWTGGEEQRVGGPGVAPVAEADSPQAVDEDHAIPVAKRAVILELACAADAHVEGVNRAVAEIPDQQVTTNGTKVFRRQRYAPGCIERSARHQPL